MDFNKPGPNKRVCAFFIDTLIAQIAGNLVGLVINNLNVSWVVWLAYILFKDALSGQSIGKFLVGIQVLDKNNMPITAVKAIVRNIFMVIPIFPLIEYFVMSGDREEGRRIGDKAAETRVNDLKPQVQDSTFLWISLMLFVFIISIQIGTALNSPEIKLLRE